MIWDILKFPNSESGIASVSQVHSFTRTLKGSFTTKTHQKFGSKVKFSIAFVV